MKHTIAIMLTTSVLASANAQAAVATFDNLPLANESFYAPNTTGTFSSGDGNFEHNFTDWGGGCCWSGFTYSNTTDATTAGFTNQYSAITASGVDGSANYAVSYDVSRVNFASAMVVNGAYFTNTTYAYLAMRDGNDGAGFVKGPFTEGDFFTLTVTGLDLSGLAVGSIDIALAEGSNVVSDWMWSDLSSLGSVYGLQFSLASSDTGSWGMNTPAYFAMDNLTTSAVPVPAAVWLFVSGLMGLAGVARRRS